MEFLLFLLQTWEKALIAIALLIFVFYVILIYFAISSCYKFQKLLKSYETSMKMSIIETITLIRQLAEIIDFKFDEETKDKIDQIESFAGQDIVKGHYKEVYLIYMELVKHAELTIQDKNILEKIENNKLLHKEIDNLYQKALFYHGQDLGAYNYWVKFILTRPFTKALKFNKKESVY